MAFFCTRLSTSSFALLSNCKLTIGPAIENGFYYDADFGDHSLTEKDLVEIEKKFLEFARQKFEFKMRSASKEEAIAFYTKRKQSVQDGINRKP